MKNNNRTLPPYLPPLLLIAVFLLFVLPFLAREFWFDEALTLMNFAWMSDPIKIYTSYVIPNNQILYTICLHYWTQLPDFGLRQDFFLRLLSLLFALLLLILMYRRFKTHSGSGPLLISMAAMALSSPFLIYATALRGYMASAFFVLLTQISAMDFMRKGSGTAFLKYFAGCILTLAVIPSNLLALGGCVLYALPLGGSRLYLRKRSYLLAFAPFAALGIVYLPIWRQFVGVAGLGEGWQNGAGVLLAFAVAVTVVSGVLLLPAVFSALLLLKRRNKRWFRLRFMIWFLPAAAVAILPVSPFPRVFFPLFPLLCLLVAGAIRDLSALYCRLTGRWRSLFWYNFLGCGVVLWSYCAQAPGVKKYLSSCCGGASGDDYFYGYYMRKDHQIEKTARMLKQYDPQNRIRQIYFSFTADPWPCMYYLLANNLRAEFLFDGPRGRVTNLEPGCVLILNRSDDASAAADRFTKKLTLLFETPKHRVFTAE